MSVQTKLYVDDKVYEVLEYRLRYYQNCDYNYRPHGKVFGGMFDLVIETTKDEIFTAWATHPAMMKNAKIVQTPIAIKSRTFELIDTHCTFDKNHFRHNSKEAMKNYITLSPAILKLDGRLIHAKHWKVSDINAKNIAPTIIEEDAELIHYFITDLEDNELEEYETGNKIRLHIETKNAIGKKINLSLNDKTNDFKHNGKLLVNDTLKNYLVTSDLEKVELDVIDQQN